MNIETPHDLMELALVDPKQIIETCFWVVNKSGDRVPFIFNDLQNEWYYNRTMRDDILKAGQVGFSTAILAILTVKFLLVPNAWAVSLSYEADATARLFSKVDYWLDRQNLHPILQPFLELTTDRIGQKVNKRMGSRFYVGTAGAHAFGRGDTIRYAHLSETSRWKDAGTIATGIIRAVPLPETGIDTWIVGETTANGVGNYHHKEFVRAMEGKSKFKAHFILWLKHKEYELPGAPIEHYDDTEKQLMKLYPLLVTDAKLRWRRSMIASLKSEDGRTPEDMFRQEFPSTWQEAFLFSGTPVFPLEKLQEMMSKKQAPIAIGELIGMAPNMKFMDKSNSPLKVWQKPVPGRQYIIFADVGETTDRCVATVLDRETAQVVAKWKDVLDARSFGKEVVKLGYWYNTALTAIEINNMGQSTQDQLIEANYPNIYFRQRLDKVSKEVIDEVPGWRTTSQTKAQMIGHFQNLIAEGHEVYDEDIIGELMTFVRKENGKMEAVQGAHDDCVISVCGAYFILRLHPYTPPTTSTRITSTPGSRLRRMRSVTRK